MEVIQTKWGPILQVTNQTWSFSVGFLDKNSEVSTYLPKKLGRFLGRFSCTHSVWLVNVCKNNMHGSNKVYLNSGQIIVTENTTWDLGPAKVAFWKRNLLF